MQSADGIAVIQKMQMQAGKSSCLAKVAPLVLMKVMMTNMVVAVVVVVVCSHHCPIPAPVHARSVRYNDAQLKLAFIVVVLVQRRNVHKDSGSAVVG
jgi:hypothetical protein